MKSAMNFLLLLFALCAGCSAQSAKIERADKDLTKLHQTYKKLSDKNKIKLASDTEPGTRLVLLGRLVTNDGGKPIANHKFTIYQADNTGDYGQEPGGDPSTGRLSGRLTTDKDGRFLLDTILPGDYGNTAGNRHIHLNVPGAKPVAYDFFFEQYVSIGTRSWVNGSDQAVLVDLKSLGNGGLLARVTLPVKGFSQEQVK